MSKTEKQLLDIDELVDRVLAERNSVSASSRLIVGLVGAPASGKSTLAKRLAERLNEHVGSADTAVVVPMDGYHFDNVLLDERGQRAVKGAPHTFDARGLLELLKRLKIDIEPSQRDAETVYIPVFDRDMDLARCAASAVLPQHRIIIMEGNYLLLKRPVWCEFAACFDLTVFLQVGLPTLERRLIKRWLEHGHDEDSARTRALSNDIPNARVVSEESAAADITIVSPDI